MTQSEKDVRISTRGRGFLHVLLILTALIIVVVVGLAVYIGDQVYTGITTISREGTVEEDPSALLERAYGFDDQAFIARYAPDTGTVDARSGGHVIAIEHIRTREPDPHGAVVLVHPLGGTKETMHPVAEIFLEGGWDVYTLDQRGVGGTTSEVSTNGVLEAIDLADVVLHARENGYGTVGVWGSSFGGLTVGVYSASEEATEICDFAILDCPAVSAWDTMKSFMSGMDLGGMPLDPLVALGDIHLRIRQGASLDDAELPEVMKKTRIPVLFAYTEADELFSPEDITRTYEATGSQRKEIEGWKNAEHAEIFLADPAGYAETMLEFAGGV